LHENRVRKPRPYGQLSVTAGIALDNYAVWFVFVCLLLNDFYCQRTLLAPARWLGPDQLE
jgi:hypothetical protein